MAQRKRTRWQAVVDIILHRNDDRNELLSFISMYNIFKHILFAFPIHRDRNHKIVEVMQFCTYIKRNIDDAMKLYICHCQLCITGKINKTIS
jgi:glutaminase